LAAAQGDLARHVIEVKAEHAATVVLVSGGYPGDFKAGYPIGLGKPIPHSVLFHSGTRHGASGV
jgi:phosphoribosylamine--glycine ligase